MMACQLYKWEVVKLEGYQAGLGALGLSEQGKHSGSGHKGAGAARRELGESCVGWRAAKGQNRRAQGFGPVECTAVM